MLKLPPLGLYVHLPWCERKCPYCDFNSHAVVEPPPFGAYRQRLLEDLELDLAWVQGRAITSVFLGGGTPSLFPAEEIAALIEGVRTRVRLAGDAEITLEANPGSAETAKFRDFRATGINRLSIGVQSFDDACLRALGRIHDSRQAHAAIDAARSAGFTNFNIDLMHGLPDQDARRGERDLREALRHEPPHLSWYQLTIEPNTHFYSEPPRLPGEEVLAAIQERGEALLAEAGLQQYEVSAFARSGHRCAHNLNYWRFGDYLGIGAGAHGKLSLPAEERIVRTRRTRVPRDYLASVPSAARHVETVPVPELPMEFLMNALRLRDGVPAEELAHFTGCDTELLRERFAELRAAGLLDQDNAWLRATTLGYRHLDTVLARLA